MFKNFVKWCRRTFWRHKWVYRNTPSGKVNPYSRRCSVCGKHEESLLYYKDSSNRSWWETWNEGRVENHWLN